MQLLVCDHADHFSCRGLFLFELAGGYYHFDGLFTADDYVVYIPSTELPLGYGTSGTPVGVEAEAVPGTDNNNNGVVYSTTGWASGAITLQPVPNAPIAPL